MIDCPSLCVKPGGAWTLAERESVARLIVNPATNGGTETGLDPVQVAHDLDGPPAWAWFRDGVACLVIGLIPYDASIPRGILHVAGDGSIPGALGLARQFVDALPGVDVLAYSDSPALLRLARRHGARLLGDMQGYTVISR
jgi:hypothetical protein